MSRFSALAVRTTVGVTGAGEAAAVGSDAGGGGDVSASMAASARLTSSSSSSSTSSKRLRFRSCSSVNDAIFFSAPATDEKKKRRCEQIRVKTR